MLPERKILVTKKEMIDDALNSDYFFEIEVWRSSDFKKTCSVKSNVPKLVKEIIIEYLDKLIDLKGGISSKQKSPNHSKIIVAFTNMRNILMEMETIKEISLLADLLGFEIKLNNSDPYSIF